MVVIKKEKEMKKLGKHLIISILVIITILLCTLLLVFRNELITLNHIKKLDNHPFYEMTYYADYGIDELTKQGVNSDEALVNFVSNRLLKGLPLETNVDGACSAFYTKSLDSGYLLGRNFDYHPSTAMLVRTNPKDGYRSISMVNLTHIGYDEDLQPDSFINKISTLAAPYIPLDGMNEKGFAIAVLVVEEQKVHQSTGKTPITTTTAIRLLLDKAATVDEAISLLDSYDMNSSGETGYHFFLADAHGNSAVVEYIENNMQVLRNSKQDSTLAATNFTLTTEKGNGGGYDRYETIQSGLKSTKGIMSTEETMNLLEKAQFIPSTESDEETANKYADCSTQWSAVYNLSEKVVEICIGTKYERKYIYSFQ